MARVPNSLKRMGQKRKRRGKKRPNRTLEQRHALFLTPTSRKKATPELFKKLLEEKKMTLVNHILNSRNPNKEIKEIYRKYKDAKLFKKYANTDK